MTIPKYLLLASTVEHRLSNESTYDFFLRLPTHTLILLKYSHSSSNTAYVYNEITMQGGNIVDKPHPVYGGGGWLLQKIEIDTTTHFLRFDSLEEVEQFLLLVIL